MKNRLFCFLPVAAAFACIAWAANMSTDYDHKVDFGQFHTYSWLGVKAGNSLWQDRITAAVDGETRTIPATHSIRRWRSSSFCRNARRASWRCARRCTTRPARSCWTGRIDTSSSLPDGCPRLRLGEGARLGRRQPPGPGRAFHELRRHHDEKPAHLACRRDVGAAAGKLVEHQFISLPVVNSEGHYAGMFGIYDLLSMLVPRVALAGNLTANLRFIADDPAELRLRYAELKSGRVGDAADRARRRRSPTRPTSKPSASSARATALSPSSNRTFARSSASFHAGTRSRLFPAQRRQCASGEPAPRVSPADLHDDVTDQRRNDTDVEIREHKCAQRRHECLSVRAVRAREFSHQEIRIEQKHDEADLDHRPQDRSRSSRSCGLLRWVRAGTIGRHRSSLRNRGFGRSSRQAPYQTLSAVRSTRHSAFSPLVATCRVIDCQGTSGDLRMHLARLRQSPPLSLPYRPVPCLAEREDPQLTQIARFSAGL